MADRYVLAWLLGPAFKVVVALGSVRVKLIAQSVHSEVRSVCMLSRCAWIHGTLGHVYAIVSQSPSGRYLLAPQVAYMHCASSRVALCSA